MDIDKIAVGKRIRDIRINYRVDGKNKTTLEDFAKLVDSDKSNVSRWERGKNIPNEITLRKIADLGSLSVDELLYGREEDMVNQAKKNAINIFINSDPLYKKSFEKNSERYKLAIEDSHLGILWGIKDGEHWEAIEGLTQMYVKVLVDEFYTYERSNRTMLLIMWRTLDKAINELQNYKNSAVTIEAVKNKQIDIEILEVMINDLKQKLDEIKVLGEMLND